MFGLSAPVNLFFTVVLLLAVVVALPRIRAWMRRRQDPTEAPVPPLSTLHQARDCAPDAAPDATTQRRSQQ